MHVTGVMRGAAALLGALLLAGCRHDRPSPPAAPAVPPTAAVRPLDGCAERAITVRHHRVDLELHVDPPVLHGSAAITVRALRDTSRLSLDATRLKIARVTADGANLRFTVAKDRLCVELPAALRAGEERVVDVVYEASTDGRSPVFAGRVAWAGYQTSAWTPTLQDPAERATLELLVTTRAGLRVVGSGAPQGTTAAEGDRVTHAFRLETPSPPFLFAFAAGDLDEATLPLADGHTLRALGPRGSDLARALAVTAPMVAFLSSRTGVPLPSTAYTQVFVPGDAAQEAAGMALLSASSIDDVTKDPTEDWIFAHELAHQWFGWLVPCADFSDFWLNEGFATFLVAAWKEERHGRAAYEREVALWKKRSAKARADGKDAPVSLSDPSRPQGPGPTEADLPPRGITYARGALVLDRLRRDLGDAAFWSGVRRYVADRAGKSARTEDLRRAMEAASGTDLRGFFATWVYAVAPEP